MAEKHGKSKDTMDESSSKHNKEDDQLKILEGLELKNDTTTSFKKPPAPAKHVSVLPLRKTKYNKAGKAIRDSTSTVETKPLVIPGKKGQEQPEKIKGDKQEDVEQEGEPTEPATVAVPVIVEPPGTNIEATHLKIGVIGSGTSPTAFHSPAPEKEEKGSNITKKYFSMDNLNIFEQQKQSEYLHAELSVQKKQKDAESESTKGLSMRSRHLAFESLYAPQLTSKTQSSKENRGLTVGEAKQQKSKSEKKSGWKKYKIEEDSKYLDFEDVLENHVMAKCNEPKGKLKAETDGKSKDDLSFIKRSDGSFVQTPIIHILLLLDTQERHKCLRILLKRFATDRSDVVIPCTEDPDVLQLVNNHSQKSHNVGRGGFGHVYKITNIDSEVYAKKRLLHRDKFDKNEVQFLYTLGCDEDSSKYFPKLYGFSREHGTMYIREGFVESTWFKVKVPNPLKYLGMFKTALQALVCLAKHGISHRDIKPSNLGCDKDGNVTKVLDFGSSQGSDENFELYGMTPAYIPPEVMKDRVYHANSDIYQLGLSVLWLVVDYYPYQEERREWFTDDGYLIKNLIRRDPHIITKKVQETSIVPEWKNLLLRILEVDPDKRISAEVALQHRIFTGKGISPFVPGTTIARKRTLSQKSSEQLESKSNEDLMNTSGISDLQDLGTPESSVVDED